MRSSRSILRAGLVAAFALAIAPLTSSCAGSAKPAGSARCGADDRPPIDCASEASYTGYKAEGGFGVMALASAGAKHEEVALRRIEEETKAVVDAHAQLCRDYNACTIDKDAYAQRASAIRDHLTEVSALVEKVKDASGDARAAALGELYRFAVPDDKRAEEVALRLGVVAEVEGTEAITVRPGMPLPTNARVWFQVEVTPQAYVYIFQKAPNDTITVLFPEERIGTSNPLSGDKRARIPNDEQKFRLNDKDLGVEDVYFVASRTPLASLDGALARVRTGKVRKLGDDALLSGFAGMPAAGSADGGPKCRALTLDVPADAPKGGCSRSRGLVLNVSAGFGEGASMGAVTEAGDDLIVNVFPFEHTTEADYKAALQRYQAQPTTRGGMILEKGPRTRGGMILEKKPTTRGGMILEKKPTTRGGMILE